MRRVKADAHSRHLHVMGCGLAAIILPWAATAQAASAGSAPPVYTTTTGGLAAVAAVSADDAWAVGWESLGGVLILHWNGRAWSQAAVPALPRGSELADVAASSARNAWAVGAVGRQTLILHWNGARWSRVPSPTPSGDAGLDSVTVTRSGAAWAVGGYSPRSGGPSALILRWTSGKWRQQPLPDPANPALDGATGLSGVAAASADRAWAVGQGDPGYWTTFARWRGTRWRVAASPNIEGGILQDVALAPRGRAWAVGYVGGAPLIMRYSGSWRRVATPRLAGVARLNAVAVTRDGTAWAVGHRGADEHGLILRWNGHRWESQPAPAFSVAGSSGAIVTGVAAYSDGDAWAVGVTNGGDGFILQWNGASW
jgi:hypothetical protein